MATIVLQVAGAAIGAAIGGPVGATIGRAVGAAAGYAIDRKLFSKDRLVSGGRLEHGRVMASGEGAPVPRVYGRVKIGGQLIWATRFEEVRGVSKQSSKGGPTTRTERFTYFGNFAVAVCEGPVSHVGRIWADGREIDRTLIDVRVHDGSEDQEPDSLIEAVQGAGNVPAYRGMAYAVFERFDLTDYGNRVPQFTFEVIRSIGGADASVRSVSIIPGAGEFAYAPEAVTVSSGGVSRTANRHVLVAGSDWQASIDELQALCPNLESVSLVVAWFGDDLRCGSCSIRPRVEGNEPGRPAWEVNGVSRSAAAVVSQIDGAPAYGGTPSDASVLAAIADCKARGLKVSLYPFLLMDIPAGNALPDAHGGAGQPAYPWRGLLTCDPAPGQPASADRSATAAAQLSTFAGTVLPEEVTADGNTTACARPDEWSLRRMVYHHARLAQMAGGVDGFIIASELRGLTTLRDGNDDFPFVGQLQAIAAGARSILGSQTRITYAADWSEYACYQPPEAPGDLRYHLDPLWADANIDAIGIDNYMPLTDWQDGGDPGNSQLASPHQVEVLQAGIAGGEGFDWYYASQADRLSANRTPITDGLGEPWVWRFKDILSWWQNPHHERLQGDKSPAATAWLPASKPVWMVEAGCPAIDRGSNQPNVFLDAKSAQSAIPHFSRASRDDLIQLRVVEAIASYWQEAASGPSNPVSAIYGGPMIDPCDIAWWAWDARPFPAFPMAASVWSDGANWHRGHWLNGRLGTCPLDRLIAQIFADHGLPTPATRVDQHLSGFLIAGGEPLRNALEPLIALFNLSVTDDGNALVFRSKGHLHEFALASDELADGQEVSQPVLRRSGEDALARELTISHAAVLEDWEPATTASRRLETGTRRIVSLELPVAMERNQAAALAEARLRDLWIARDALSVELPLRHLAIEAGDLLQLSQLGEQRYRVDRVTDGDTRLVEATAVDTFEETAPFSLPGRHGALPRPAGRPQMLLLDLPATDNVDAPQPALLAALAADPWHGPYVVSASPADTAFVSIGDVVSNARIGVLLGDLAPGCEGRFDHAAQLLIRFPGGAKAGLSSLERLPLLAGGNALAVQSVSGEWEIIQYADAELLADGSWQLSTLLRGQSGSGPAAASGSVAGAYAVLLDDALVRLPLDAARVGLDINYQVRPAGRPAEPETTSTLSVRCDNLASRPLAPAHLRLVRLPEGGVAASWIRRSRVGGDNWDYPDPPLDEPAERYRIIVETAGGPVREAQTTEPAFFYEASMQANDLGGVDEPFVISVSQIARTGLAGPPARHTFEP